MFDGFLTISVKKTQNVFNTYTDIIIFYSNLTTVFNTIKKCSKKVISGFTKRACDQYFDTINSIKM